ATQGRGFSTDRYSTVNGLATLGFDYDLGDDWLLNLGGVTGTSQSVEKTAGLNAAEVLLALNGTASSAGTAPSNLSNSSLVDTYGLNTLTAVTRTLTTADALDVWNPAASNRTNPAVLRSIMDGAGSQINGTQMQDLTLHADGPIGDFWNAGAIKAAVGGEFTHIDTVS